jgi:cell division septum initiation protein DivIVA
MDDKETLKEHIECLRKELEKAEDSKKKLYVLKRLQTAHDELSLLYPVTLRTAAAEEYQVYIQDTIDELREIIGNIIIESGENTI